jgi:hypothetical protein
MMDTRLPYAINALTRIYRDDYVAQAGAWPDVRDEARAVAEAIGHRPVEDEAVLEAIYDARCDSLDFGTLAQLHLMAIDQAED